MFRNYLKTALRTLRKTPVLSLVNVLGLSAGLTFFFLIGAYIWGEWHVNAGMPGGDRLYIVRSDWKDPNMGLDWTTIGPISQALHEQYPQLVTGYYHHDGIMGIVSRGDKHFSEGLQVGDASFLTLFGFKLLYGDAPTALNSPDKLVLTDAMAVKFFGRKDVLGQTLSIQSFSGGKKDFTIGGVLEEPAYNTITYYGSAPADNHFFLPATALKFFNRDGGFTSWQNPYIVSYIQLAPGVRPAQLEAPLKKLIRDNAPNLAPNLRVYLTPLHDYYLHAHGDTAWNMIRALALIAVFILLMAVINFVNMSLGNSVTRLREIGVRKVLGSLRRQLVGQFLTESVVTVLAAALIATGGFWVARPFFGDLLDRDIPTPPAAWLVPIGLSLAIGTLAGLYPALALSGQQPSGSLKGNLTGVGDKKTLRYTLLTLQFVSAIVVLIAALTIRQQIAFFFHADLGYKKDRIVSVTLPRDWSGDGVRRMEIKRDELSRNPDVEAASFSFEIPDGNAGNIGTGIYRAGQNPSTALIATQLITDENYAATYKIPVVAGAMFNTPVTDSLQVVVNETAAKALGFASPGQALRQPVKTSFAGPAIFTIAGVIKDFHFGSMRDPIGPLFIIHPRYSFTYRYMTLRLRTGDLPAQMSALRKEWARLFPDAPFNYSFQDDALKTMYDTELRMDKAAGVATVISLVIVLLGVFGIVSLSLTRRTREVGIRKVLGASLAQLIALFTREFLLLLGLANLIAWPLAYLGLRRWLDQYAYKVDLTVVPFVAVGTGMALLITALIAIRALKTARANPVQSLRTE